MARKPPKLDHVRWIMSKGKQYAYFNTGQSFAIVEKYARRVNRKKLGKAAMLKFEAKRDKSA